MPTQIVAEKCMFADADIYAQRIVAAKCTDGAAKIGSNFAAVKLFSVTKSASVFTPTTVSSCQREGVKSEATGLLPH